MHRRVTRRRSQIDLAKRPCRVVAGRDLEGAIAPVQDHRLAGRSSEVAREEDALAHPIAELAHEAIPDLDLAQPRVIDLAGCERAGLVALDHRIAQVIGVPDGQDPDLDHALPYTTC